MAEDDYTKLQEELKRRDALRDELDKQLLDKSVVQLVDQLVQNREAISNLVTTGLVICEELHRVTRSSGEATYRSYNTANMRFFHMVKAGCRRIIFLDRSARELATAPPPVQNTIRVKPSVAVGASDEDFEALYGP